jgi:hypothetical protein
MANEYRVTASFAEVMAVGTPLVRVTGAFVEVLSTVSSGGPPPAATRRRRLVVIT